MWCSNKQSHSIVVLYVSWHDKLQSLICNLDQKDHCMPPALHSITPRNIYFHILTLWHLILSMLFFLTWSVVCFMQGSTYIPWTDDKSNSGWLILTNITLILIWHLTHRSLHFNTVNLSSWIEYWLQCQGAGFEVAIVHLTYTIPHAGVYIIIIIAMESCILPKGYYSTNDPKSLSMPTYNHAATVCTCRVLWDGYFGYIHAKHYM